MVVLRIALQHLRYKCALALGRAQLVDDDVSVVPDLVILEVLEGCGIEPDDFVPEGGVEFLECFGAVEPVYKS
jgi:hypothetical protein